MTAHPGPDWLTDLQQWQLWPAVHPGGDLVGLVCILGVAAVLPPRWRAVWLTLTMTVSGLHSAPIVLASLLRAELLPAVYHLVWVVVAVVAAAWWWTNHGPRRASTPTVARYPRHRPARTVRPAR